MTAEDGPDAGRVVPAYALTRGRTRPSGPELPLEALATATELGQQRHPALQTERRLIVELCARPQSIAEIGAHLRVPVGVARVLVSDLVSNGYLAIHLPRTDSDERPDVSTLERLLEGLRAR